MGVQVIIYILACVTIPPLYLGQTLDHSVNLMSEKLTGYDKRHRPVLDQSQPIIVNLTFEIVAIQDFDEVKEKFSVVGIVNVVWFDEKLRWNPASYGGIMSQPYKYQDIWYPTLILANPHDKIKALGDDWMVVRVYANGFAYFTPGDVFKATCSVDVTYYPFDTQTCSLMFVPWGYPPEEISLKSTISYVQKTYFSENGEWDLIETSAIGADVGSFDAVTFYFKIRRKPMFVLINVLLPIVLMLVINILVFVLPTESGERVSFAVTVLLAQAVFLTMVANNLPKTSQPMSILCYFLMLCLILSTLMGVCAIFSVRVYFKGNDLPIPVCITALTRVLKCAKPNVKCQLRQKKIVHAENNIHILDVKNNSQHPMTEWISDDINSTDEKAVTWKDVSFVIDNICILGFLLAIVITISVYLNILINNTEGK